MIIYREQLEPTIERKRKADYREATDMLAKVRDPMARTGHVLPELEDAKQ